MSVAGAREMWEPFEPTAADPWDLRKVAHLHRRAGFGANWQELHRDVQDGPAACVDRLLHWPALTTEEASTHEGLRRGIEASADRADRLQAYWFYRILFDPVSLRERMTLFWHSHFATSNDKVRSEPLMLRQNELLRSHALGPFDELLRGILADPAMLIWLDGANSPKERPNENLAREFLELFTLGVGNYTEADIRAAARAFTGWVADDRRQPSSSRPPQFHPAQFDDGEKTFLQKTGHWSGDNIVDITLDHPAAAEFLCRKLYRMLLRDDEPPAAEVVAPLAEAMRAANFSIKRVVEVILRSRHFYSRDVYRNRIKSPVELSAGLLRELEVPRRDLCLVPLADACARQGQHLFYPPNVAGWIGGRHWITSTNLVERCNWLTDVVWGRPERNLPPFDPLQWADRHGIPAVDAPDALIELLVQGDCSDEARTWIRETARQPDSVNLRKAIQLIVHCPEYQLA